MLDLIERFEDFHCKILKTIDFDLFQNSLDFTRLDLFAVGFGNF